MRKRTTTQRRAHGLQHDRFHAVLGVRVMSAPPYLPVPRDEVVGCHQGLACEHPLKQRDDIDGTIAWNRGGESGPNALSSVNQDHRDDGDVVRGLDRHPVVVQVLQDFIVVFLEDRCSGVSQ